MKSFAVLSAFAASAVAQQVTSADFAAYDKGMSREQIGHKVVSGGTAPSLQQLKPRFTNYHSDVKRTKVRYGPYKLPSTADTTLMSALSGEQGTMTSMATAMQKPCSGKCNLIAAQAGLEYANGTVADTSNGAWLHHVVMITGGAGHSDGTCKGAGVGAIGERTFSSGNERTPTTFGDIAKGRVKSGFPIAGGDIFSAQLELMNLNTVVKSVYLTVDFEYIPGDLPKGFKRAHAMWLDVTGCGISSVNPPAKQRFTLSSRKWTVGYNGDMLGVGGHLHDGGVVLNVYKNQEKICISTAKYGMGGGHGHGRRGIGGLEKRQGNGPSSDGKSHIQEMSTCRDMGRVKSSDQIWIDAEYDYQKHAGMTSKTGKNTEVMGIAIMYLASDT